MDVLFKIAVQHVSVALLASLGVVWLAAWIWREHRRACAKLSAGKVAVLLAMAFTATIEAQKRSLPSGGNGAPGETAFAPPPGAVTNDSWLAHGAYEDWFHIPATNWWARTADGWLDGVTVLAWGEFRPDLRTTNAFPRPFPQKLSLAPMANWGMLVSHGGTEAQSLFWHCVTESNTLVLTWQDALYDRSHTNLVSFQAELFNDGAVAYRYDGSPVATNDFVHPAPTNWEYGVTYAWDDATVNSNAYYWVEVAAERGPAEIVFAGDRQSDLGDPVVVARGGETNRIPLLIGIRYAVTSDVPFTVAFTDSGFATISTNGPRYAEVVWPLDFTFTEGFADGSRVYTVDVVPYDPGGVFSWELPRRGAACGCVSYSGRTIVMGCTSVCGCGGGCAATGAYMLESAIFGATGGVCRCGFDDPEPPGEEMPPGPGLSVSFSKGAVIYEDTYEDSPGDWKPKRSTRVRLTVSASGGPHGGTLWLTDENLDKLSPVACGPLYLPSPVQIAAGDGYRVSFLCEAAAHSTSEDDVKVTGVFTENDTGESFTNIAELTVVQVELQPRVVAPENDRPNRHSYGVCELVQHLQYPSAPSVIWNPIGGGSNELYVGSAHYRCPLFGCENPLRAEIGGVYYPPLVEVVEPRGMSSKTIGHVVYSNAVHKGEAGGIGMKLHLYVEPLNVSFSEISVEEVPCLNYLATGYFDNPYYNGAFCHTRQAGAGRWGTVDTDNMMDGEDDAAYKDKIPWLTSTGIPTTNSACAWTDGTVYIDIPFGWNVAGTKGDVPPYKEFGHDIRATIRLDARGKVGVWKLNNNVERTTNDVVRLYGPRGEPE